MSARYFVILDNNLIDEPLAPGLPYWTFSTPALPTRETATQFVEDVLFQSELWANDGRREGWVTLRLVDCQTMCSRCGHILVVAAGEDTPPFHVVWYIAENPYPDVLGDEGFFGTGGWHADYLAHRCPLNFFDGPGR